MNDDTQVGRFVSPNELMSAAVEWGNTVTKEEYIMENPPTDRPGQLLVLNFVCVNVPIREAVYLFAKIYDFNVSEEEIDKIFDFHKQRS